MKKIGRTFFLLLASMTLVAFPLYAGHQMGAGKQSPGVGKGPESGVAPGYGHSKMHGEKYHHQGMRSAMDTKRASEILGKTVVGSDGKSLGTLHDLVIFGKGSVHYGILERDNGKDYAAIPFQYLEKLEGKENLILHMDSKKIENAPSFSLKEINDWDNSEIGDKVHGYFGMEMMRKGPEKGFPGMEKSNPGTGKLPESGIQQE